MLSERELESRYEVWVEQYITRANIEAETAEAIAKTMILPAALRYLALIDDAGVGELGGEVRPLVDRAASRRSATLDEANDYPDGVEGLELAEYARDNQLAAMAASARPPTSSRASSPTTSGRCRSTRRSSSCAERRQPSDIATTPGWFSCRSAYGRT